MTTTCRCPVRPYYSIGSLASGSTHETALLDRWEREHSHHAFAKARDKLATAFQSIEGLQPDGTRLSGEDLLLMTRQIFDVGSCGTAQRETIAMLRSAVKSGETWTEALEKATEAALRQP